MNPTFINLAKFALADDDIKAMAVQQLRDANPELAFIFDKLAEQAETIAEQADKIMELRHG